MSETTTEKRRDMYSVKPENLIVEEGFNVRLDMGDIEALAQSIKESGLKTPLRVYRSAEDSSKLIIVNGHRRKAAIDKIIADGGEIEFVDVIVEPRKYSDEQRTLDLILTNDGKSLRQIEEAIVFERLKNFGWNPKQIAQKSGRSLAQVYNLLDLALVPQKIKNFIVSDKISEGTVIALMRSTKDQEQLLSLTEEAIATAKSEAIATGKPEKKATVKHVKGVEKVKTPFKILEEVAAAIIEAGVNNDASQLFIDAIEAARKKKSVKSIVKMLND